MDAQEPLRYLYGQLRDLVAATVEGLDVDALRWRPDPQANPIGWLVWHQSRVQDDHVAAVAGHEQVWVGAGGWPARFGMSVDDLDIGYGATSEEVAALRPASAEVLVAYHDAVTERTLGYVEDLDDDDLRRVVDERWDPPVTLAVRLQSVLIDSYQHVGQAAYVRGLWQRRGT